MQVQQYSGSHFVDFKIIIRYTIQLRIRTRILLL